MTIQRDAPVPPASTARKGVILGWPAYDGERQNGGHVKSRGDLYSRLAKFREGQRVERHVSSTFAKQGFAFARR